MLQLTIQDLKSMASYNNFNFTESGNKLTASEVLDKIEMAIEFGELQVESINDANLAEFLALLTIIDIEVQPHRYVIKDWAGNTLFNGERFDTFDDAWAYIYDNVDDEGDESTFDDYTVILD